MDAIIISSTNQIKKKTYRKPAILQELLLEAKAGSLIPAYIDPIVPPGGESFISPGDFSINNEP